MFGVQVPQIRRQWLPRARSLLEQRGDSWFAWIGESLVVHLIEM